MPTMNTKPMKYTKKIQQECRGCNLAKKSIVEKYSLMLNSILNQDKD